IIDGDDFGDGVDDADADGDGVDDGDEPGVVGDIRLGSGADTLDIRNGGVFGDIDFGGGADVLKISGGAQVRGAFSDSNLLAITVTDGTIEATNTTAVTIASLDIGSEGDLVATVNPDTDTVSGFNVTGTATFADGAGLGIRFTDLIDYGTTSEEFTIVSAGTLNVGNLDLSTLDSNTPFMYIATAEVQGNNLVLDVRLRNAEEAGFIASEAAAFESIYGALSQDGAIRNALLSRLNRSDFMDLYRQLMPEHSGAPLLSLEAGIDAVRHALSDRTVHAPAGETTAWLQEINFYADKQQNQSYAFRAEGFGVAGGLERGGPRGNFGISGAYTSSDMKDRMAVLDEVLTAQLFELGVYYRLNRDDWRLWARGAAGYAMFDGTREVIAGGFQRKYDGDWDGYSLSAGVGASYDMRWRKWYARAEGSLEYFSLMENAYCEADDRSGSPGYCVEDREGHIFKAEATMNIGRRFGEEIWFTPEFRFGWRHNISAEIGATTARPNFAGGIPFTLYADAIEGGGPVLGFRLMAGSGMGFLGIEGNAVLIDDYDLYNLMIRGGFRF
ncbi:MAG TPA: autotransporter outer membrane beta-barrel domain-containing protein, partial [Caulobacteraceae bacterium]|nr:autotransporter outer membrane beta-barrel domain-containing protein [Caulobacteraceae bacterium]